MSNFSDYIGGSGGGSSSQINEVVSLQNDAAVVTLADSRVYLKGGIFETDLTVYPNASNSFLYTGTNFNVAAQEAYTMGITWDGTSFWTTGRVSDKVWKYTAAGVYTNVSFSVASEESAPEGIAWDGTSLWVVGYATSSVYQYEPVIGVASDASFGGQNYVRVA